MCAWCRMILVMALAAGIAAGCNPFAGIQPGGERSTAGGTAPAEGYPVEWTTQTAAAHGAGYPAPQPTTALAPTWTVAPTPDYAAALPRGAVVDADEAEAWYDAEMRFRDLEAVPYTLDSVPGIAIVDTSTAPPVRRWSLAEADLYATPIEAIETITLHRLEVGRWGHAVLASTGTGTDLLTLKADDDHLTVRDRLPVPDPAALEVSPALAYVDLSGDGVPQRLLLAAKPLRAWCYTSAATDAASSAGDGRMPPPARLVGTIEGRVQLVDVTGDGVLEALAPAGDGRWRVHAWRGEELVAGDIITDTAAPTVVKVVEGSLPPLTRDLFFWRDGEVVRAPRAGGPIEVVYAGADDPGWAPIPGLKGELLPLRPYAVSRDGRTLVVVEQGCSDPKCTTNEYRFQVRDLATGRTVSIPWHRDAGDGDIWPSYGEWELSADGRWLVFPQRARAAESGGGATDAIVAVNLASTPPDVHRLAACDAFDTGTIYGTRRCEPELLIAPDSARVAYSDAEALRLAELPGGGDRVLVPHHYGDIEVDIRGYHPVAWSPDGSRLLVDVGWHEGSSSAVLDVESGTLHAVPDSDVYGGPLSEMAWFPDGQALVHARSNGFRGGAPLRLVTFDGAPAETTLDVGRAAAASELDLLPVWNIAHGADLDAVAPAVAPDGSVRFVLRNHEGKAYHGSGVFSVKRDGTGWTRLVALPPDTQSSDSTAPDVGAYGVWTDDASFLLLLDSDGEYAPLSPGDAALLIPGAGGTVTDIGPVVEGGEWFVWAGGR